MLYRDFPGQDAIDAQYQTELTVDDLTPYFEFYANNSAKARDELECMLDIPFGPTVEETLDIFPGADPNGPIIVFVHGGYWRRLSAKEFSLVALGLVPRGATVILTNYALCPKVTIPEITRQSRAAMAWIRNTGMSFPGDRERIYALGHSAGGQQVVRMLQTDWVNDYGLPETTISGAMSFSGLFDLRPLRYSWLQPLLQLTVESVREESPIFSLPQAAPPLIALAGALETQEFHRQSADFIAAWNAAGLIGEYGLVANKNHFNVIDGLADPDSALVDKVMDFIGVNAT